MPGMLTPAELARLGQARGAAFDRLFLGIGATENVFNSYTLVPDEPICRG
jgi:hypothetical protein